MSTDLLSEAIILATTIHNGQVDKAGMPYILHPIRVMVKMKSLTLKKIAILHDVLEDSSISIDDIRNTFGEEVSTPLEFLTRKNGQSYDDYIHKISENSDATIVKIADLEDNMDVTRIDSLKGDDLQRLVKYTRAWQFLRFVKS